MYVYVTIAIFFFLLSAFSARAQDAAADPKAIDLTSLMQIIDSSTKYVPLPNLNIGDIDGDGYEDMVFGRTSDSIDVYSVIHYGGSKIFAKSNDSVIHGQNLACLDLNADGKKDLVMYPSLIHWNTGKFPYYSYNPEARLSFRSYTPYVYFVGVSDYEEDGSPSIIADVEDYLGQNKTQFTALYNRKSNIDTPFILPIDSLAFASTGYYSFGATVVSKFGSHLKPMIVYVATDTLLGHYRNRIGIARHQVSLSQDSIVWISNSDSNGVVGKKMYAMDITGDGVADLLVSDGLNIYIYRGNDNFGSYRLTKDNAYFVIKSPAQLELVYTLMKDFGGYMRNCGDLTGSGTPLLMVTGTVHDNVGDYVTYAFFYSGGKALDTYYDAIYREYRSTNFTLDTLHAIDNTGRAAVVFQSEDHASGINFLIYNGCRDIPRTPNPNLGFVPKNATENNTILNIYPSIANKYVRVNIPPPNSNGELHIYNVLGQIIESRKILEGDSQEIFINTTHFANGMYIVAFDTPIAISKTKFIVEH